MRKIILNLAVSLDSYIEGPNGEYDWCIMDEDMNFPGFLDSIDTIFFGRRSYDLFTRITPQTSSPPEELDMLAIMQAKKKYVFSHVLSSVADPEVTVIKSPYHDRIKALRQAPGKDIWLYGGANLVTSFVNADLIDEYQLSVHPIILGGGKPLFIDIVKRVGLKLIDTKTYRSGVVNLIYSRA